MGERITIGLFLIFAIGAFWMAWVMFSWPLPEALDLDRSLHGW